MGVGRLGRKFTQYQVDSFAILPIFPILPILLQHFFKLWLTELFRKKIFFLVRPAEFSLKLPKTPNALFVKDLRKH